MWLSSSVSDPRASSSAGQSYSSQPCSGSSVTSSGRGSPPLQGGEALSDFYFDYSSGGQEAHIDSGTNLPTYLLETAPNHQHKRDANDNKGAYGESEDELQLASSRSFINILEKELNPHNSFTQNFLQSIISSLDSKDPVVANAWLETLLDVIDLLPKEVIKKDILNVVISKGQLSQPISSRLSCCKMLGKICTKFEPYLIKKEILPLVQSLCQDTDYEVRGCMCRQLDTVARGMGFDAAKTSILPELVELANDEETYVRLAGIETVVNLLTLLDDETCSQTIVPLVKKFCQNSMFSEDATLPVLSFNLGKLCHGLSVNLSFENKQWFVDYFRQLARLGLNSSSNIKRESEHIDANPMPDLVPLVDAQDKYKECRQNCAYNFPAMVLFTGPQYFSNSLYHTFSNLCSDPCYTVRQTIACGFHEIAKLLGPTVEVIYAELVVLLNDQSIDVLKGLIPHLPDTLEAFAKEIILGSDSKSVYGDSIISALVECEVITSRTSNWRLHSTFLDKMSCLTWCLSSDVIYSVFVPLFVKKLHTARPIPCRIAAARTLLTFLKFNRSLEQRNNICKILNQELCHGHSCHSRSLYIDCCFLALDLFSKSFFKRYFFKELLSLADDKVVNIRLRLCSILPHIKSVIKLPPDKDLLQLLESCIRQLMLNEQDKDVSEAVQHAIAELDKIELMVESMHLSQGAIIEEDLEDLKKEEEEKLIEMEGTKFETKDIKTTPTLNKKFSGKIPVRKVDGGTPKLATKSTEPKLKHSKSFTSLKSDLSSEKASSYNLVEASSTKSSLPTKNMMKTSSSSSSLCSDSLRRCSTGSLSKIPSPCSSPVTRRQSYESLSASRIPSPTFSSPKLPRAIENRKIGGIVTHTPKHYNSIKKELPQPLKQLANPGSTPVKDPPQISKQLADPGSTPISSPTESDESQAPQQLSTSSSQIVKQHVSRIPCPANRKEKTKLPSTK